MALTTPSFANRVAEAIETGNYYVSCRGYKSKPKNDETIWGDGSGYSKWSLSYRLGWFTYSLVLNREGWEPIKLTRQERKRLAKAYEKALRAEWIWYKNKLEELRR